MLCKRIRGVSVEVWGGRLCVGVYWSLHKCCNVLDADVRLYTFKEQIRLFKSLCCPKKFYKT